jgi:hypothetical protein
MECLHFFTDLHKCCCLLGLFLFLMLEFSDSTKQKTLFLWHFHLIYLLSISYNWCLHLLHRDQSVSIQGDRKPKSQMRKEYRPNSSMVWIFMPRDATIPLLVNSKIEMFLDRIRLALIASILQNDHSHLTWGFKCHLEGLRCLLLLQ